MIQVQGWIVVVVMVAHAMLAVFNERIREITTEPLITIGIAAALVGLNILGNAMKPLATALRTLTRKGQ